MQGLCSADEARQEEAATSFEAESALAKDEADFCVLAGDADVCG